MGQVVAGVPGVVQGGEVDLLGAALGVEEAALPLGFGEGLQEQNPAGVEAFDDREGPFDGGFVLRELGEGGFVVAGDRG